MTELREVLERALHRVPASVVIEPRGNHLCRYYPIVAAHVPAIEHRWPEGVAEIMAQGPFYDGLETFEEGLGQIVAHATWLLLQRETYPDWIPVERLARKLASAITRPTLRSASNRPQPDGPQRGTVEWLTALRSRPRPRLATLRLVRSKLNAAERGARWFLLYANGSVYTQRQRLDNAFEPIRYQLLEDVMRGQQWTQVRALAALAASVPPDPNEEQELELDAQLVRHLRAAGAIRGTLAPYEDIRIELAEDKLRLSIRIPEHIADAAASGICAHWPEAQIKVSLVLGRSCHSRPPVFEFAITDQAYAHHPLMGAYGRICIGDSAQVVAHQLDDRRADAGLIAARSLLAARNAVVYGVTSDARVHQPYERTASLDPQAFRTLSHREARKIAAARRIEIVPWR